jgi:SAM-dependent methyltransferase
MSELGRIPADWYDGFFETDDWLDRLALPIPAERTEREAAFIRDQLALSPGARVLDLCCGHGRIALELARRGHRVTGLDLSERSLAHAREAAGREGLELEWIHADMREVPEGPFDAIVNVFTAFGYFEEEAENQRVLDGVARALRPGGRFLIDVINPLTLARRYRDSDWEELDDGVLFLQRHRWDFLGGRNEAHWSFVHPDGRRGELHHSLRMYAPHELRAMLERAGLEVTGAWGDWEGGELSLDGFRLILRAERPG